MLGTLLVLIALSVGIPAPFAGLLGTLLGIIAVWPTWLITIIAIVAFVGPYLLGYLLATAGIAPLLPVATAIPTLTFPVAAPVPTPAGVGVVIGATALEFFGRGLMIGMTAAANAVLLSLVALAGPVLASWAFTIVSLSAVIFVARNRIYQGFLGWSAWLLPVSWLATGLGVVLFLINIPLTLITFGIAGFRIDWTTGVIESHGGVSAINITGVPGARIAFCLGNFSFLGPGFPQASFTAANRSSHETGHTLNTAATGGVVLYINAIDETIFPRRLNLAYGELLAEGHADNFGTLANDYALRWWF